MDTDTSEALVSQHGRVFLASQPSQSDLMAWAEAGVSTVINSRTPEETADLPFDLKQAVESRGMVYVEMPIGGAYGASPIHTAELAAILDKAPGNVVLHCRTGTRSAHLYAAHLISVGQAGSNPFETMGWPGPADPSLVRALVPANA